MPSGFSIVKRGPDRIPSPFLVHIGGGTAGRLRLQRVRLPVDELVAFLLGLPGVTE